MSSNSRTVTKRNNSDAVGTLYTDCALHCVTNGEKRFKVDKGYASCVATDSKTKGTVDIEFPAFIDQSSVQVNDVLTVVKNDEKGRMSLGFVPQSGGSGTSGVSSIIAVTDQGDTAYNGNVYLSAAYPNFLQTDTVDNKHYITVGSNAIEQFVVDNDTEHPVVGDGVAALTIKHGDGVKLAHDDHSITISNSGVLSSVAYPQPTVSVPAPNPISVTGNIDYIGDTGIVVYPYAPNNKDYNTIKFKNVGVTSAVVHDDKAGDVSLVGDIKYSGQDGITVGYASSKGNGINDTLVFAGSTTTAGVSKISVDSLTDSATGNVKFLSGNAIGIALKSNELTFNNTGVLGISAGGKSYTGTVSITSDSNISLTQNGDGFKIGLSSVTPVVPVQSAMFKMSSTTYLFDDFNVWHIVSKVPGTGITDMIYPTDGSYFSLPIGVYMISVNFFSDTDFPVQLKLFTGIPNAYTTVCNFVSARGGVADSVFQTCSAVGTFNVTSQGTIYMLGTFQGTMRQNSDSWGLGCNYISITKLE